MRVEKQARARGGEKLVNLAADIAEIDIGAARIAHVEQAVGCEVDHDLAGHRQLRHRRALGIACFCEQANMRSDDEVVAILACEPGDYVAAEAVPGRQLALERSEEHTSELQSLMRISYAVFC